jgi:hypothetical protein
MATAEEMRARFEARVSPPGPTDEKLAATLGLLPAAKAPANGKRRPAVMEEGAALTDVTAQPAMEETDGGGGVGLDVVGHLFPAPEALAPADGQPAVKLGFPVPVPLMREVVRFKVDLSRHLARRISNHEIGAAALGLLPGDPGAVADLLRRHAHRIGIDPDTRPCPSRRLVASVPSASAAGLEDLVLGVEETEGIRVTKSQCWALAHVLLLERAGP